MFVLGVLVGRGTAPLKFDLAAMQKKISVAQEAPPEKQNTIQPQKDRVTVKDKTKLEFYEALKEDKEDTKVSVRPEPKDAERKDAKSAEKAAAPVKSAAKSKPATIARTNSSGPTYTIQAAAVRNAKDADRLIQKLKKRGYPAYRTIGKVQGKGIWFRVRVGSYKSKAEARRTLDKLKKDGLKPILVLRR